MLFHMAIEVWANFGPGSDLLPGGTKPLPGPILTNNWQGFLALTFGAISQKVLKVAIHKVGSNIIFLNYRTRALYFLIIAPEANVLT